MKSISGTLAVILILALAVREFDWKARGILIAAILAMIALTIW